MLKHIILNSSLDLHFHMISVYITFQRKREENIWLVISTSTETISSSTICIQTHECYNIHISLMMITLMSRQPQKFKENPPYCKLHQVILVTRTGCCNSNQCHVGYLCLIPMELLPLVERRMVVLSVLGCSCCLTSILATEILNALCSRKDFIFLS